LWFPGQSPDFKLNGELISATSGFSIPLVRPSLILGRRQSCDIVLDLPKVSGIHCHLYFKYGWWSIRDLHSTNGVRINGVRVDEKVLQAGDTISIARRDFTIQYTPPAGSPTPLG
jgi:adenylate cyclase